MAQVLKEEVQRRLLKAAAEIFAERGFQAATMAQIAAAAGVATGNVYRYYESKDVLFEAVVPAGVVRELSALVRGRVRALSGTRDVRDRTRSAAWRLASQQLIDFTISHRLATAILLSPGRADGTPHAGFSERMVPELVSLAVEHAESVGIDFQLDSGRRFALQRIYRGLLSSMAAALLESDNEAGIRSRIDAYSSYHLAGMKAFLEGDRA